MSSISPDLAVVIVTWNVRALVLDTLRTLIADLDQSGLQAEVWVVDNASTDGTPDAIRAEFPSVRLIARSDNLGFARGNNLALRELGFCDAPTPNPNGPRAVFLLNPDTLIHTGAVRILYDTLLTTPDAGIVGARLEYADGTFQHGAFAFPGLAQIVIDLFPLPRRLYGRLYDSRINGRYPRAWYEHGRAFRVGHTLGATMMLRREAIEQTGLFDEQFYMYCEEIDWSMRIQEVGWHIYCQPAARVTHLSGQSTKQIRAESLLNLWCSRLRLYEKHYSPLKVAAARFLVRLGMQMQIRQARKLPRDSADQRDKLIGAYREIIRLHSV